MSQYREAADRYARQFGVDPMLFRNLIQQESGWRPDAVSPVGATGLTQTMPATARQPGYGVTPLEDPTDPNQSLRFGAEYLAAMLDQYDGDVEQALVAYNWGPGNANKWNGDRSALPAETRGYLGKVMPGAVGPTRARAEAGLPLARQGPTGPRLKNDPAVDNTPKWKKRGDEFLRGLGFPEPKKDNNGLELAQMGLRMMNGGF